LDHRPSSTDFIMIKRVIVLGGGSAGFMAAIALKVKIPVLDVRVIRSKEIGVITVGESSTPSLPRFLHNYLGIHPKPFFEKVLPTWKMGLHFIWGPRRAFNYSFGPGLDVPVPGLRKRLAYYCNDEMDDAELFSALMARDRCWPRGEDGNLIMHPHFAYHLENEKFVDFLEGYAAALGVRIGDEMVSHVLSDESGITGLVLKSGPTETADLYVDCSGFASLLLGRTLQEPYTSFRDTLYNDRALVGSWMRDREAIRPYTTCETMNSGWCWRIEHEDRVNRGYVYCSSFITDEEAERELRAKNPKIGPTRIIRFITGCYRRNWVKNVVAIGNASGFVEPLESTALAVIAAQSRLLAGTLIDADLEVRSTHAAAYSELSRRQWESIRAFIAIHYKFNTRLDTPYWRECREKAELAGARAYFEYYQENGPSGFWGQIQFEPFDQFHLPGYIALLVGQKAPCRAVHRPEGAEAKTLAALLNQNRDLAAKGFTVEQGLAAIRSPKWVWPAHMLKS
jgi:tryptophan halogenase